MSWLDGVASILNHAANSISKQPSRAGSRLTRGQLEDAQENAQSFVALIGRLIHGTATLDDDMEIGVDLLTVAAIVDPQLAPLVPLIAILAPILVKAVETGQFHLQGDMDPERDANAYFGRGGRGN
jgi:hypothetical protein